MWSINDVLLQIIRVGDFVICVEPNIEQNWRKFLTSLETTADTRVLFLHPAWFWFWYKSILKSPRMYNTFFESIRFGRQLFHLFFSCHKEVSDSWLFGFLGQEHNYHVLIVIPMKTHLKVLISNGRNIYYYFCFKLIDCEGFVQLIASASVIGTVKL